MIYFSLSELTSSATARKMSISNIPDEDAVLNLKALIYNILDPARKIYGAPIFVHSGYRCERLNKVVGGVKNSQHLKGEAADIDTGSHGGNRRLYEILLDMPFDQLIWEKGDEEGPEWIHVSYRRSGNNRGQLLRI